MRGKSKRKTLYVLSFVSCAIFAQLIVMVSKADSTKLKVEYCTFVDAHSQHSWVAQGESSNAGEKRAVTGLRVVVVGEDELVDNVDGNVIYSVYSKENAWSGEIYRGEKATSGEKNIKAIKLSLTGGIANNNSIEYRSCNTLGQWTKWGRDGEVIGNISGNEDIVDIQIRVVDKVIATYENGTQETGEIASTENATNAPIAIAPETPVATVGVNSTTDDEPSYSPTPAPGATATAEANSIIDDEPSYPPTPVPGSENQQESQTQLQEGQQDSSIQQNTSTVKPKQDTTTVQPQQNIDDSDEVQDAEVNINSNPNDQLLENAASGGVNAEVLSNTTKKDNQDSAQVSEQAIALLKVARTQLGTKEIKEPGQGSDDNGSIVYGKWYKENIDSSQDFEHARWCAMFVTWCANRAGISESIIKPYAACWEGEQFFRNQGVWHDRTGYTPKKGDIVFFSSYSHTGMVEYIKEGYVHTIEGNKDDMVKTVAYPLSDGGIKGYASPKYSGSANIKSTNVNYIKDTSTNKENTDTKNKETTIPELKIYDF